MRTLRRHAPRRRRWRLAGMPLRVRLVAAVLALVVAALAVAGVAAVTALHGYLLGRVDTQLRRAEVPTVQMVEHGVPGPGLPGPGAGPGGPPSEYHVVFADASGQVVSQLSTPIDDDQSPPRLPERTVSEVRAGSSGPFTVDSTDGGTQWRVVASALRDGSGTVYVATSLAEVDHTVERLVFFESSIGGAVVILLGALGYVLVRRSLRPLVEIERTAAAIAGGDLTRRVPDHPPRTEVGRLATALNGMLTQIETAFRTRAASEAKAHETAERMRRFAADASHELRTPLTSIRGFAELYRQGAATGPADVARFMRRIEDESARMGLLVDDLLLLARLDRERPLERAPVDLLAVATDAVQDLHAAAPDRPVELRVCGDGGAPVVSGDEARLRQVVANLTGNAVTHTPAGTPVTISVGTRAGGVAGAPAVAVLEVTDQGPGLADEDARRVFERFYRTDRSRARSSGGTGLGLSIVSALTAAHGGTVELDTRPERGATFRVLLPLSGGARDTLPATSQAGPS